MGISFDKRQSRESVPSVWAKKKKHLSVKSIRILKSLGYKLNKNVTSTFDF